VISQSVQGPGVQDLDPFQPSATFVHLSASARIDRIANAHPRLMKKRQQRAVKCLSEEALQLRDSFQPTSIQHTAYILSAFYVGSRYVCPANELTCL